MSYVSSVYLFHKIKQKTHFVPPLVFRTQNVYIGFAPGAAPGAQTGRERLVGVAAENLKPGMVLGKDVVLGDGRTAAKAPAVLDASAIAALRRDKVAEVEVFNDGDAVDGIPDKAVPPAFFTRCSKLLAPAFAAMDTTEEPGFTLRRLSALRAAKLAMTGQGSPLPEDDVPLLVNNPAMDLFQKQKTTPEKLASGNVRLPAFPAAYVKITELLASPHATAADIADVVSRDTALAARLLKLVNSPFYGASGKIESLSRAVTLLGGEELNTLVLGVSAMTAFKNIPARLMDMDRFWRHSIACGVYAGLLAERRPGFSAERFFIAGLLHDVGRLIMYRSIPAACARALLLSYTESMPLHLAEREIVGFDHSELSDVLLGKWRFPEALRRIIADHHRPAEAEPPAPPAIVQLADIMALALRDPLCAPMIIPDIDPCAWAALETPVSALGEIMIKAEQQILDIEKAFLEKPLRSRP